MSFSANFEIVGRASHLLPSVKYGLVIRDVGPWDKYATITNDVRHVVRKLVMEGLLDPGDRLFYYDSEGQLDEIVIKDGEFWRIKPGPARR